MPQKTAGEWPSQFARELAEALADARPGASVVTRVQLEALLASLPDDDLA
jgi:hypothetical protein